MTSSTFDDHLDDWRREQESPWGRLRYSVVRHTLDRTIGGREGLRVLDLGGGDAADSARLADRHDVTVHDFSEPLLARARIRDPRLTTVLGDLQDARGQWDLVLCHNVVHYVPDLERALRTVSSLVAPGGQLSLMAPNPAGEVVAALVRTQDPGRALDLLVAQTTTMVTFDHVVRRIEADEVAEQLQAHGLSISARYGIRCANDLVADDARKHDPQFWDGLLALELAMCNREPWTRTGRFWQLVAERPRVERPHSTER